MIDPSFYEILGVSRAATDEEIRSAYRRAVRQTHPDAGGTGGMFSLVQEAYEVLSDPEDRAIYDDFLEDPSGHRRRSDERQPAGGSGGQAAADEPGGGGYDPGWGTETQWTAEERADEYFRAKMADPSWQWDPENPRRHWSGEPKPNFASPDPDWAPKPYTLLSRISTWLGVLTWCSLSAVLLVWPGSLVPAAAGGLDADGGLRWATIPAVILYTLFSNGSAATHPIKGSLAFHGLTVPVLALWLVSYWPVASGGERMFMTAALAMWAAWTIALAFYHETSHRNWDGFPLGDSPVPPGGFPEPKRGPVGRTVHWVGGQLRRVPLRARGGTVLAGAIAATAYLVIAYVMLIDPDLIIPDAATSDLRSQLWIPAVAATVVVLYSVVAFGACLACGFGGLEVIHLGVVLCGLAWWAAYGDIATPGEWRIFWIAAAVWLTYRLSFAAACVLAERIK